MTVSYVLNKRSKVLHRLPADERCNTDQIKGKKRFEIHASETVVTYLHTEQGIATHFCRRCFPDAD